ncbi:phosphate ABC transporter substrate-binding protein [Vibrio sp. JC009]|uniref:phosphate ABC transporter substrate-binding protein n=1 Tax=Vibrio sp. JC009 TaxID=2912314 RepID=UPI0023B0D36C|nr:phosphate ABC transporter substrate-binding protein [Vibrio sp. JC009]WED24348.1 phosphate ABC transporter substrate-binding protein [Vibrio sp. JC009]
MLRVVITSLLAILSFSLSAAGKEVNISGSTSVARIMDILAEEYNNSHGESFVAVQGVGSTAGITLVDKGVAEIGMSSRYLTEGEMSDDLAVIHFAYDGLAVIVNHTNPTENLSRQELYDIYKGKVTNWKQLGGPDRKIAVVTREASSGSRYSFETQLGLIRVIKDKQVSDINPNNLVVNSNSMVKSIVNNNVHAIGFVSEGSVDHSVKELKIDGVEANQQSIASGEYQLARPFILLYKKSEISENGKSFVSFVQSERAKKLISQYGYIPTK